MHKKTLSIIIPILNELENVKPCIAELERLRVNLLSEKYEFEYIFTDNHSTDGGDQILLAECENNPRIKYIRFSSNVGYQLSILTGFLNAKGSAAIQFDCDMQDPIEVAANFVKLWSDGFKIVYGVRKNRSENFIITLVRKFFYRSLNAISDIEIPVDAGDFRLLDREVYERLRYIKDPEPYLRGIVSAFGYKQHGVPYERSARSRGESKFPFKQMYKLGLNGVFNHSLLPLRLATICGIVGAFICLISFVIYLIASIFYGRSWPAGFSTIVLLIFLQFSVMSLFFGILGEYIGRIYRFIKPSKFVICEKTANIDKAEVIIPL